MTEPPELHRVLYPFPPYQRKLDLEVSTFKSLLKFYVIVNYLCCIL